jgi:hypothetical protein
LFPLPVFLDDFRLQTAIFMLGSSENSHGDHGIIFFVFFVMTFNLTQELGGGNVGFLDVCISFSSSCF